LEESTESDSIIQVEELEKKFGELTAVKQISFEVKQGEIFGFLGPNGAGKTTTINMLCTLLKPTSGRAILNGYDVCTNKNEVRESIGLVFQDPSLDDRLSALENLQFHAVVYRVPVAERASRIKEVLEMVELTDRADDRVETYSGGMKRRLEIARGLLHYPKVLFLDEPTIGLDPQTRSHIWNYVTELKQHEDITIFLTTHYMDEAENCDRIAIIDNGKIIALDTPEHLKGMVGGDVVKITTADDPAAERELKEKWKVEILQDRDCLCFEVEKGEEFVPNFIRDFGIKVDSISVHRPTLDDVFMKLTGREIREQGAEDNADLKAFARFVRPPAKNRRN
jgi:ABC-2 type transport system ATP-binding protein